MGTTSFFEMTSPLGTLRLEGDEKEIFRLEFIKRRAPKASSGTPLLKKAGRQLEEYFKGKRLDFDLPLKPVGTPFQGVVWKALTRIPCGETRSYKELASLAGSPKAFRAVGGANNKNPLPIFIPCHRVIGSDGKLVGYGGGLKIKKWLLSHEESL